MITKIHVGLRYVFLVTLLPLTVIFAFFIKLIRPILLIRWTRLDNAKFGHLATDVEIYLLEKKFGLNKPKESYIDFFYKPELKISNKQLYKMWKKKLIILPWSIVFPLEYLRQKNFLFNDENYFVTTSKDRYNLYDKTLPRLSFSDKEKKKGFDFLRKIGLPEKAKFVCLHVRDGAFHSNKIHNYHNYRNCNIENFRAACKFLAEKNIYVFRMGSKVEKKISFSDTKIIDYATNGMRTDFLDIFLSSECLFWISTGSGIDQMSKLFRKPHLNVNQVPIGHIATYQKKSLIIFKHFFDKKTNNKLSIDKLVQKNLCFSTRAEEFENKNVIIKENNLEELKSATKEMLYRIDNNFWDMWKETKDRQKKFWNKFPYKKDFHGTIVANIGKEFLIDNENFYS